MTATLMVQGTTSDAGKSTLVTALGRILHRRSVRVAPFKPQNMALNSAVTADGGEIGRSQAVQAYACGLAPHTDMNPVLLKPSTDVGAQVIIHGRAMQTMHAREYQRYKATAHAAALESYRRLARQYDVILVEGAGSPAEINLRRHDIANMGFATAVGCPVLLIADIDRGGVFAHLVGTLALLSEHEQELVVGFVINRFRGDIELLQPGLDWLEQRTGKPVLGVLPYLHNWHLEAEDAIDTRAPEQPVCEQRLQVVVPALPRISNHTDFDPLRLHPAIDVHYVKTDARVPPADLIILPGSKSVCADLAWLRQQGWVDIIQRHLRYGGKVLGICGGLQILGHYVHDPLATEGRAGGCSGLGLLDLTTVLKQHKQLRRVQGELLLGGSASAVTGYEIHTGETDGPALARPAVRLADRVDGAVSADDQIAATYLHGIFETSAACNALLRWAGLDAPHAPDYRQRVETDLERLADVVEGALDMPMLMRMLAAHERPQDTAACTS